MSHPLLICDFLDRAIAVHPERTAIVDEPSQPARSWGCLSYADIGRLARAPAAALDALGVRHGARVANLSQNSTRLLASFFGVSGWGRIPAPIADHADQDAFGCCRVAGAALRRVTPAAVPSPRPGPWVYGPAINTAAVLVASEGNVPIERTAMLIEGLLGGAGHMLRLPLVVTERDEIVGVTDHERGARHRLPPTSTRASSG